MSESLEKTAGSRKKGQTDPVGTLIIAAAAAYILFAVLSARSLQSANDRSRWCTVWSLVERGTYQIDEIDSDARWSTIDKVRHRRAETDPYHFYSSKPPLFPTMVAGLYWLEKQTLGYDLLKDTELVTRLILLVVNACPMILALLCLQRSLLLLPFSDRTRWMVLVAAGFASMLNPYLTTLNNHTPAAVCLLFSLAAIIRLYMAAEPQSRDFAIVGVSAALTCCFELPAALFGILSFFAVVRINFWQTLKFYVPAALVPLAAFFITNLICTGGYKPFYTYYGTDKYVYVHEGIPSYWSEPRGIDANQESPPIYLLHCTVGHHGIFSLSPVLVLSLVGWVIGLRSDRLQTVRIVFLLGIGISATVLGFYLTRTQNYNYGGNSCALRWMLWLTPFWWYGMAPAIDRISRSWLGTSIVGALIAASFYSSYTSLTDPWKPNWLFVRMEKAGWIDYRTPIPPFNPPRFSVIARFPDSPITNLFRGGDDAAGRYLKLSVTQGAAEAEHGMIRLLVQQQVQADSGDRETIRESEVTVVTSIAEQGKDVSLWVQPVDEQAQNRVPGWLVECLRGLSSPRPYNAASPRYLRYTNSSGEKTAVRCDRGASRVAFEHPEFGKCWQRCDVYYCDEADFGVAQWKISVTQHATNRVVYTEVWTCRDLP